MSNSDFAFFPAVQTGADQILFFDSLRVWRTVSCVERGLDGMPSISICKSIDHILYEHAYDNTICQAMSGFCPSSRGKGLTFHEDKAPRPDTMQIQYSLTSVMQTFRKRVKVIVQFASIVEWCRYCESGTPQNEGAWSRRVSDLFFWLGRLLNSLGLPKLRLCFDAPQSSKLAKLRKLVGTAEKPRPSSRLRRLD